MRRAAFCLVLALAAGARGEAARPGPEALLPADTLACWQADSLADLGKALAASPVHAGALDGTWAQAGATLLDRAGIPVEPVKPVLWNWIGSLAPHCQGPVALAWLKTGPAALARLDNLLAWERIQAWAEAEARARNLKLSHEEIAGTPVLVCERLRLMAAYKAPWCLAARDRETLGHLLASGTLPPKTPLSGQAPYRAARAGAPGSAFLYLNPGALAGKERAPFADAVGWGCAIAPDGVTDTLRLVRPGRQALFPEATGRLARALPPDAAATLTGRVSARRLRECLTCLLGKDPLEDLPLPAGCGDWEGEVAVSFRWMFILPDLLVGVESKDPESAQAEFLKAVEAAGGKRLKGNAFSLPSSSTAWVAQAGEGALWIGTNPASVAQATGPRPPGPETAKPLQASFRFPPLLGPASLLAGTLQQNPDAAPLAKLLTAKAAWDLAVTEDADGVTLISKSPWGIQPLLGAGALGLQALNARPVAEAPEAVAARVQKSIPRLRGLDFATPVDVKVISTRETHAYFEKAFDKEMPPEKLASAQETMRAFGLLKPGQELGAVLKGSFVDLVGGFYDPETKGLYLIRRMPGQAIVAAHELTHALQDQHFDLEKRQKALKDGPVNSDRDAALLAVIEGDATAAMEAYLQDVVGRDPGRGLRVLLEVLAEPGLVVTQLKAMLDMPEALLRQTMFSYEDGKTFVAEVREARGWKGVDALFERPPASTEQVLHPGKYLAATPDAPVAIDLKDLTAKVREPWTPVDEDTMGELGIQAFLRTFLPDPASDLAAAGWGGDRFALFRNGEERILIWRTVWDTEKDAQEFEEALGKAWAARGRKGRIVRAGTEVLLTDGPELP